MPYRRSLRTLRGDCRKVIGLDVNIGARTNPGTQEFCLIDDAQPWPLSDQSVDLVLADFVLEHVEQPGRFLHDVARVLKPGGVFCARTTNRMGYVGLL